MPRPIFLTAFLALALPCARAEQAEQDERATPARADPKALEAAGFTALFDGASLDGWKKTGGTAQFEARDGAIAGFGRNIRGNTFLRTKKSYSDFMLVFEFRFVDPGGNSGCQFRSRQRDGTGRVFGYQCEHDNNRNRSYTAGVYDEARRGWLYPGRFSAEDLAERFTQQGQNLFRWDDWNTIAIRCEGRRIQTWLNGVARADFEDTDDEDFTPKGFIALQVHGGKSSHVQWRHLYLKEL